MPLNKKIDRSRRNKSSTPRKTEQSLSFPDDESFEATTEAKPTTPKRSYGKRKKKKKSRRKTESPQKKLSQDDDVSAGDEIIDPDEDEDDESYREPAPIIAVDDDSDHSSILDDASEQPISQESHRRMRAESSLAEKDDSMQSPPPRIRADARNESTAATKEDNAPDQEEEFMFDRAKDEDYSDGADEDFVGRGPGSRKSTRNRRQATTNASRKSTRRQGKPMTVYKEEEEDNDEENNLPSPRSRLKGKSKKRKNVVDDGNSESDDDINAKERVASKTKARLPTPAKPTRGKRTSNSKKKVVDSTDEDEFQDEVDANSDDDDFVPYKKVPSSKWAAKPKKSVRPEAAPRRTVTDSANDKEHFEEEEENGDDDDEDFEGESDSDDEDFNEMHKSKGKKTTKVTKKTAKAKESPTVKRKASARVRVKKVVYALEEESEEELEDESEEEQMQQGGRRKHKKRPNRMATERKPNHRTSDRDNLIVDSDENADELMSAEDANESMSVDDEDHSDAPPPRSSRRSLRNAPKKNLREDSNSDIDAMTNTFDIRDDTSPSYAKKAGKQRHGNSQPATKRKKRVLADVDDGDEDDVSSASEVKAPLSNRGRSARKSATKASKSFAAMLNDEEEDDDNEYILSTKKYVKNMGTDGAGDDEDFKMDDAGDAEDSSEESVEADEEDQSLVTSDKDVGNVDADFSFLDADESSDDGQAKLNRTPPSLKIVRSAARRKPTEPEEEEEWDTENNEDEDNGTDNERELLPRILASPQMPYCLSTTDEITMDPLPKKHICFYTPDGKTKQCFALETLHKIALTGTTVQVDNKLTFKQPPHFRSPISDDLLDQIAFRFGRAAVDPTGQFYKPKSPFHLDDESSQARRSEFDYIVNFNGNLADDDAFFERYNRYLSNHMGGRDIYCCPICYTEAHRRLETDEIEEAEDDGSNEDESERVNLEFIADPITVVGCVDGDEFKLASSFCFTLLKQVKNHLRKHHHVDTSAIFGNDLYKRFQIRASDGLLQRYLDKRKVKNSVSRHGEMMGYWFEGNNELFVFLLHLMNRQQLMSELLANSEHDNEEDTALQDAQAFEATFTTFWASFANRGKRLWSAISEPYLKATQEEIDDFVNDDDGDEGEDVLYHLVHHGGEVDPTPDDEIVAALRARLSGKKGTEDASSSNEAEVEYEKEEEDELMSSDYDNNESRYYSEEEEEDEWIKKVKSKGKARIRNGKGRSSTKVVNVPRAKRLGGKIMRHSSDANAPSIKVTSSGVASTKKRRLIVESDSDDG